MLVAEFPTAKNQVDPLGYLFDQAKLDDGQGPFKREFAGLRQFLNVIGESRPVKDMDQ
jgi:hypothetical protein